jgi:hypothetical protein
MRYIIVFFFFCSVAYSQSSLPTGGEMWETTLRLETITDSAHVITFPIGAAITRGWMVEDSVGGGDTGALHIGIQGEVTQGRFYTSETHTISAGRVTELVIQDDGGGYITSAVRQAWVYTALTSGQIRIIFEYRRLR